MKGDPNRSLATVRVPGGTISLAMGDITAYSGDAVVNAANPGLLGGGGVDGAIHRAAGRSLYDECKAIVDRRGPLAPGHAVMTGAGRLPVHHVIHTVGPVWGGGNGGEADTLTSAYTESVRLAAEHNLTSVAFPSISTGAYGYPVREAAGVAVAAVRDALAGFAARREDHPSRHIDVTFVLFDDTTYAAYADALAASSGDTARP